MSYSKVKFKCKMFASHMYKKQFSKIPCSSTANSSHIGVKKKQ